MSDTFRLFWEDQAAFMRLLVEKRGFPKFPLNLDEKSGQRFIKSILHDMMCEVSEVIRELKNSKKHRAAEVTQFDRAAYLEEICDVQKFVLEVLLLSGITPEEFKEAYFKKSDINIKRINEGY